jgi:hypothetical protein
MMRPHAFEQLRGVVEIAARTQRSRPFQFRSGRNAAERPPGSLELGPSGEIALRVTGRCKVARTHASNNAV